MRKVLTFLSASLVIAWAVPVLAQQAPDTFKDVPTDHWAYPATEALRAKNILIGYPDGYFRGKRTLTRYEFAVALDRALKSIGPGQKGDQGPAGEAGPAGPAGPQGDQGPAGVTPEELANFRRLAEEFRNELTSMGNTVQGINRKLDALAKEVADIQDILHKMPKVYGGAFIGVRSDRASGGYLDHDGAVLSGPGTSLPLSGLPGLGETSLSLPIPNLRNSPAVVHEFEIGVMANIAGGAMLDASLITGNYKNYLVGVTGFDLPFRMPDATSDTYVHRLMISTPFAGLGRDSKLTLGRFGHNVSHFTLWKPEVDTYFNDPMENDGLIYMDGVRMTANFGSVSADVFGGKTGSVVGTTGVPLLLGIPWSSPVAGAVVPATFAGGKPFATTNQGQMLVDELAGVSLGLGIRQLQGGHVRFTAIGAASKTGYPTLAPGGAPTISNVVVLGADADLKLADRIVLNADWGKSIPGTGKFNGIGPTIPGAGKPNDDNNAFNATVGYASGALNVQAGYRYIDPLFYAPGYWGRIGNWVNPTNVQGPIVRASYDFTPGFGVNVGGDFFSAAKNRGSIGGLTTSDDINRVLVGLKWNVSKAFQATADWEGVYYKFGAPGGKGILGNTTSVHPTESYVTLGAGYNLTSNTILKLSYQIGDYDGRGVLPVAGLNRYTFNTFTSQVAVKF